MSSPKKDANPPAAARPEKNFIAQFGAAVNSIYLRPVPFPWARVTLCRASYGYMPDNRRIERDIIPKKAMDVQEMS